MLSCNVKWIYRIPFPPPVESETYLLCERSCACVFGTWFRGAVLSNTCTRLYMFLYVRKYNEHVSGKGPKVVAVWTTVCTRNIRPRRRARANRWERGRDVSATTTVYGTPYRRHCRRRTLKKAHANRYRNAIGFYTEYDNNTVRWWILYSPRTYVPKVWTVDLQWDNLFLFFQRRCTSSNINTRLFETTNRRYRRYRSKTKCTCEESPVGETYPRNTSPFICRRSAATALQLFYAHTYVFIAATACLSGGNRRGQSFQWTFSR